MLLGIAYAGNVGGMTVSKILGKKKYFLTFRFF